MFGDLFKNKASDTAWPGRGTKVAIYDVSNATVDLPDGTKVRAHSGIGRMRDNPRYEHVTMRGPPPAGIYRLSMREKRFYGMEAIRMTHINLLHGQKGSHGWVAFQNYQPFLSAFKRGQIAMLVVVSELPSSLTQLNRALSQGWRLIGRQARPLLSRRRLRALIPDKQVLEVLARNCHAIRLRSANAIY